MAKREYIQANKDWLEAKACRSWGKSGQYKGIWYMSRDYIMLNTTYLFLNRHAMSEGIIPILQR